MSRSSEHFIAVYSAANATEAHVIKGMLEQHGIHVRLSGEGLSSGMGELPADVVEVQVQVPPGFRQLARDLLQEYEAAGQSTHDSGRPWKCSDCGEESPSDFGLCWNCQSLQP